ncbi:RNA polymerase sigma factor [Gemmatimonadota bacterium]
MTSERVSPGETWSTPMARPGPDSGKSPDAALIEDLRSGDTEALRRVMDRLWSPLVGFAHRTLSGSGDPEGIVQDAFIKVWSRRSSLKDTGSLRAFFYTIVRNLCLDDLRRRDRRTRAQMAGAPPKPPRTPYEDVHGAELQRVAAAAVANLPTKRQEVFRLVREEGLAYREVAEALGLSPQTVANHMSLALADLRTALRPYLSEAKLPEEESLDRPADTASSEP